MSTASPSADTTSRGQRAITLLVAGTFFMENLDGTILTTAAPPIANAFGVSSAEVGVAITAYLLTLAVLIPLSGWLTQRLGARLVFTSAIVVFTLASVLCAASASLPMLVAARVLQGIGGAMMVPVGRLTVLRVTEKKDLIHAIAWLTWPALAAPVVAPLVGGILVTSLSWHWIFLINVPLGVVALVAALRLVPAGSREHPARLDWPGLILTCGGLGALVWLGSLLSSAVQSWAWVALFAALGVCLSAAAILHLGRAAHPLLDLRSLRIATFRLTHAGGSLFRLAVNAVPFLVPLLLQDGFGWSPVVSGALVLFIFVGNLAIKPATTPLLVLFGFRTVIAGSTLGVALSMAAVALITPATPVALIAALLVFGGAMRSIGFTAYNTIAFADVPHERMTEANTLSSTVQQLAAGFGVTVGALALRAGQLTDAGAGTLAPYRVAFVAIAVITLAATLEALLVDRGAGENIRPARVRR
ncbi:MFS transporter [Microbacterium sp. STN6]|uniref:MFS transporter n=1 Tax=Microbacterium sp. STN6 TaxID=2995588 RepID=UPI0022608147|nr:MFS transporter [Microbacterium sp. STN6]MCX7521463.1 MFS transporter [Microbacterium sp. STN6]